MNDYKNNISHFCLFCSPIQQLVTQDDKRKKLVEATQGEDIDSLEKAIRDFERSGLEDLDDLTHAREKLVRLHEEGVFTVRKLCHSLKEESKYMFTFKELFIILKR